jgi:hypothetical protein
MPALAVDMTAEEIQRMVDEAVTKKLQEHERRETGGERALEESASRLQLNRFGKIGVREAVFIGATGDYRRIRGHQIQCHDGSHLG